MVGILSFLAVASAIAFVAAVLLLVVRSVKKKPRKPFVVMAVASAVMFCALAVWVSSIYEPAPKPAVAESEPDASAVGSESASETGQTASVDEPSPAETPAPSSTPTGTEKPAETEKPEQSAAPAESSTEETGRENPLFDAEVKVGDVMNGVGTAKIGEYAWIEMEKSVMLGLSQDEMLSYADDVISGFSGNYNWFAIAMDDGTGLVFHSPYVVSYGELDVDKSLKKTIGTAVVLDVDEGFRYEPAPEDAP